MPWQEQSIMEQRLEFVVLATAQDANVSQLCRSKETKETKECGGIPGPGIEIFGPRS